MREYDVNPRGLRAATAGVTRTVRAVAGRAAVVLAAAGLALAGLAGAAGPAAAVADSYSVVATIPGLAGPVSSVVDPATNALYVVSTTGNQLVRIDATTNAVAGAVTVPTRSHDVALDVAAGKLYVSSYDGPGVSVIDIATLTVTGTIAAGAGSDHLAFNLLANRLYVSQYQDDTVSVIDTTTTNSVVATIPVGTNPLGVAVDPTTGRLYVANETSNDLSIIDTTTNTVTGTIATGSLPIDVQVDPVARRLYVANNGSGTVTVLDADTETPITTIPVSSPYHMAIDHSLGALYVGQSTGTLAVIDTATNAVVDTLPAGAVPLAVSVHPDTEEVYVSNQGSSTVSVVQPLVAPTVTTEPASARVAAGGTVSFTVAGAGLPAPAVQWQVSTNGGAAWADLAGATAATLTFTASAAQSGNRYRAVLSGTAGVTTSQAATLSVPAGLALTGSDLVARLGLGAAALVLTGLLLRLAGRRPRRWRRGRAIVGR